MFRHNKMKSCISLIIFCFNLVFLSTAAIGQARPADTSYINPNIQENIVIFKTHFDIGYTYRLKDIVQYYRTEMIDKALNITGEEYIITFEATIKS